MRKTIKKSLALVLSLLMLLSVSPLGFAVPMTCPKCGVKCEWIEQEEIPATCQADGHEAGFICSNCNEYAAGGAVIIKGEHQYVPYDGETAYCPGNADAELYQCDTCKALFLKTVGEDETPSYAQVEATALSAHTLPETPTAEVEASCGVAGHVAYYECSVCHAKFSDAEGKNKLETVETDPLDHVIKHKEAKAATCTEDGNKEYWYCELCGAFFSDEDGTTEITDKTSVVLTKLGGEHEPDAEYSFFSNDGSAFDCEADGYKIKFCTKCHAPIKETRIDIPATGHVQADEWTLIGIDGEAFDCTTGGERVKLCVNCGKEIAGTREEYKPKVHSPVRHEAVAATCDTDGHSLYRSCKICGKDLDEYTIYEATGHTMVPVEKKEATCAEEGYKAHTKCSKCGAVSPDGGTLKYYDDEDLTVPGAQTALQKAGLVITKTPHDFKSKIEAKDPSCTEDGTKQVFECKVCKQLAIEATEGDEGAYEIDEVFYKDIASASEALIQKTGHTWIQDIGGAGYVAPTCSAEGSCNAFCSVCKVQTVLTLKKTPHTDDLSFEIQTYKPSCERGAYEIHKCSVCKETYEVDLYNPELPESVDQSDVAPTGHNYSGFKTTIQEASCTQVGIVGRPCLNGCGKYLDGEESAMLPHQLETYKEDPVGHTPGFTGKKCKVCGQVFDKVEIPVSADHIDENKDAKCDLCGELLCDHLCHSDNAFMKIVWFVVRLWYQFLGINETCKCGIPHYTKVGDIDIPD